MTGCVGHGQGRILGGSRCHILPWLDNAILGQHDGRAGSRHTVFGDMIVPGHVGVDCFRSVCLGGGRCRLFSLYQGLVSSQVDIEQHVLWRHTFCQDAIFSDGRSFRLLHGGGVRLLYRCFSFRFSRLFRLWGSGLSFSHLSPHLALLSILFHQYAAGITVGQCHLCHLESSGSRFSQIDQGLVVVAGHSASVHVAIGQVEFSLGKTLRRTPLKPSGSRGIILLGSFAVIVGITEVKLCLSIAQTGCFCIFGYSLLELALLIERVAQGKMPGCSHLGRVGIKYGGMGG